MLWQNIQPCIKVGAAARINGSNGAKNAPEELYFKSTKILVANRNALPGKIIKKLARRPCKEFNWECTVRKNEDNCVVIIVTVITRDINSFKVSLQNIPLILLLWTFPSTNMFWSCLRRPHRICIIEICNSAWNKQKYFMPASSDMIPYHDPANVVHCGV